MCDWRIELTCPRCGAPTAPVTNGKPTDLGTRIAAVVRCDDCRTEWMLSVALTSMRDEPLVRTLPGTVDAWVLKNAPEAFTTAELVRKSGSPYRTTLTAALQRLADAGALRDTGERHNNSIIWERV